MANSNNSTSYGTLDYAYDKVVFKEGVPVLETELNLAQELQEILSQKATASMCSGWLSYRPYYTSRDLANSFYTQDPTGSKPEVVLVNGWSIYVTNTATSLKHVNKIDLTDDQLRSGSRVDGVFLEVWRSLITPTTVAGQQPDSEIVSKPQPLTKVADLHGVYMFDELTGWAAGDSGVILKTTDGGVKWISTDVSLNVKYRKVKFYDSSIGYAIAEKGHIVKSIDGGDTWYEIPTPVTDDLNDIVIIDAQHICVVGNNGVVLLTDDGNTFVLVTQVASNTSNLNGVYFFDSAVGWSAGDAGTLLITKDGGNTWEKFTVIDNRTQEKVTGNLTSIAFYNLNDGLLVGEGGIIMRTADSGFTWVSMSDRIWNNGAYTNLSTIYPLSSLHLNKVFIQQDFPIRFTIAVYPDSKTFFKNLMYRISPPNYPNSMVLEYTGVLDNINYINVLDLDLYATAEALRDAINEIVSPYKLTDANLPNSQREKIRVFDASISYEPFSRPSDYRPTSGAISSLRPAEISFSVEDKAWIVGDDGIALITANSGAKWELFPINVTENLYDIFMDNSTLGWIVGESGTIINYNPDKYVGGYELQTSDLNAKSIGRIFPEGNVLSGATDFLTDDTVDPQVNNETTKRVQIQYRIRIVDGVDPTNYPESGLGMPFVYSLGPNTSVGNAGNYAYTNMGSENGDYGLWRARCRNSYDGYSWAVPMFFVTRRNSGAFNVNTNINGSTYFELNAVRPDALTYEEIDQDDVVDVRRQSVINSYSYHLQKNFDSLMSNNLKTNISNKDQQGFTYGSTIFTTDSYSGSAAITSLVQGGVNSSAKIIPIVRLIDPNIQITPAELTFGPLDNALFHNDPAYYSAVVVRSGIPTQEPVGGTFEGLGTRTVKFNLAQNFSPAGGTLTGVQYQFTVNYIDYSAVGLSRVPQEPISVKYIADPTNMATTYYFNGMDTKEDSRIYEYLTENVPGYQDYTKMYSAKYIKTSQDQDTYEIVTTAGVSTEDYNKGLRQFEGQQFRGSLVEYHYFLITQATTSVIRVPKNLNGYSILGVRQVRGVDGAVYKISADFAADLSIRDREVVDSVMVVDNLVIYLDPAFVIAPNVVVEVILEASVTADVFGGPNPGMGITVTSTGENQEALRTPFVSNFDVAAKGVGGLYTGVLYPYTVTNLTNQIIIDLTGTPSIATMQNALVLGLPSYETRFTTKQMYVWYKSNDPGAQYYTTVPVASVDGLGTSTITITLDPSRSVNAGTVLVSMLAKLATLPNISNTSQAYAFYKYVPYQSIGNLPAELTVEILNTSDVVYISNLGTGASTAIPTEPYEVPLEHIAINDSSVVTDNYFSNIDDLEFANFSIDTGFIRMPALLASGGGKEITLSLPNNVGDRLGRPFYTQCSSDLVFQAENIQTGTPRKVFVPVIARVRTDVLAPVLRGEIVMLLFTKVYKARLDSKTGFYEDTNVEYKPGYTEEALTAVSVYRLINKPILRK